MKQNGSSSTAKSGRSLIVIGAIIDLIMGVLLLLTSFMVRKEANSTSRYALYAATTYASNGLTNSQLATVAMALGIIFLVIGILSLICMAFSGSKFVIFILILCGIVSLIFPLPGILILCGASLESKRCAKGNSSNAGSLLVTLILGIFGLSSLIMLFRLNGRVNVSSSVNSFEGYAINYFSSFIKNETELVKYKKALTTSYLFILLTLIPAVIDLITAAICISNPMKNIENRRRVKTVSTLMWVLFAGFYALYIYKILTIKVVADGSSEVAYKGLISMANDISNRDLYPSIMLFVGPILYYLSLKTILTLARDLPVMAYAMKHLSKSPKLVKVMSYILLLIAFPLTFIIVLAAVKVITALITAFVVWILIYAAFDLVIGRNKFDAVSSDGSTKVHVEEDWRGHYTAEVKSKGEKKETYHSEDGKNFKK